MRWQKVEWMRCRSDGLIIHADINQSCQYSLTVMIFIVFNNGTWIFLPSCYFDVRSRMLVCSEFREEYIKDMKSLEILNEINRSRTKLILPFSKPNESFCGFRQHKTYCFFSCLNFGFAVRFHPVPEYCKKIIRTAKK